MAVETIPFKIFCSIQTILRWWKFHAIQVEDVFVWLGLAMFLSFDCLYLKALPILELVVKASTGKLPPYATIMEDTSFLLGCLFAVQILFWGPLWCIKFSLLFWFKKLTVGLPNYMPVWYIIAGFTGLAHILSVVTQFTNCKSILAWLTPGACNTARDEKAGLINLYFALAMDLVTDILVMAIPIRMLWNLRISAAEKLVLVSLSALGWSQSPELEV